MAYYNRALLFMETGNYRGAIADFNVVLEQSKAFCPVIIADRRQNAS